MDTARNADEILVVGAGVVGTLVARGLALRGLGVTVIDRGEPGAEATRAAGGMLAPLGEADRPGPFLELGLRSLDLWPDVAGRLESESGLSLAYAACGMLEIAGSEEEEAGLRQKGRWIEEVGREARWLTPSEVRELEPAAGRDLRGALYTPDAHRLENRGLGPATYHAARRAGVHFRLGTGVRALRIGDEGVTGVVLDDGTRLDAPRVVVAAGAWSGHLGGLPRPLPVRPVRGQMVALRGKDGLLTRIVETADAYLIPRPGGEIVVGSTMEEAGFRKETTARGILGLLEGAIEAVPEMESAAVERVWAGLRPGTPDDLPVLGPDPEVRGLLYATGHFRNGLLLAPITARIVEELVLEEEAELDIAPFRPGRFSDRARSEATAGAPGWGRDGP